MYKQLLRCKPRSEFCTRYYQWALKDTEREVRQEFPFISKIKDRSTLSFLAIMEPLPLEQRLIYASILVKNMFKDILKDGSNLITDDEQILYEQFSKEEKELTKILYNQGKLETLNVRVNTKRLRRFLEENLSKLFGDIILSDGTNRFAYRKEINSWKIDTHIFLGGRAKLNYMHVISPLCKIDIDIRLEPLIVSDLLLWLGVGTMRWDLMTDEDALFVSETLATICVHFIDAASDLLDGLSPELEVCES
jgi:hypothetical protein